jgi:acyl-CoA synthetase (AMP-forming)/AMP-acid ligase II
MSHSQSGSRGVATHDWRGVDEPTSPRFVSPWELPPEYKSPLGDDARHRNVADVLLQTAHRAPHAGIHWVSRTDGEPLFETYSALLTRTCRVLASLRTRGLTPGDVVIVMLDQPRDFVAAFWACILGGFIPCPVGPSDADDERATTRLRHLDTLLGNPFVITAEPAARGAAWRSVLRAAWIGELAAGPPATVFHQALRGDLAMLVLTSGPTGSARAVMLSHANLLASMAAKAERHELTDRDIILNWVSFDRAAAVFECHLLPLYVAATQVQAMPQTVLEAPLRFLELVAEHRVTMTFAPNFLFGQINQAIAAQTVRKQPPPLRLDLSSLRQIISGGEAIVTATARTFLDTLAPHGLARGAVWPAFGMAETCTGSIYSREFPAADEGLDFATLGTPVRGLELRIVDDRDRPIPDGQIGELQVRGPMVFGGYYANSQATAEAFADDGWFRTGDRGSLRHGRLLLEGRSKDSIIVNGANARPGAVDSIGATGTSTRPTGSW